MGTTSGAFLALSQLPGINMEAVQVVPSSCLKHMAPAAFWVVAWCLHVSSCCQCLSGCAVRAILEDSLHHRCRMLPDLMCMACGKMQGNKASRGVHVQGGSVLGQSPVPAGSLGPSAAPWTPSLSAALQ